MQIVNRLGFMHQMTTAMDVAGREFMLLVVKGTWLFPDRPVDPPILAEIQRPLVMADEYTGAPGFSACLWETDFAFRKTRCDVVLNGSAQAPGGRPATRVPVGLRVGLWSKSFDVVGHREWRVLGPIIRATEPLPFRTQPITYDVAFGGADRTDPENSKPPVYRSNPVGRGFAAVRSLDRLAGVPLPLTEETGVPITSPYGTYRPMAFGPVWRGRPDRLAYGGTYDADWEQNVFPFLPADFDERYYQQTGEDQQIDPPAPYIAVTLAHLTPRGTESFRLPDTELPIAIFDERGAVVVERTLRPDTLILDCDEREMSLVWRVEVPVKRRLTDFRGAWIGRPSRGMLRARASGRRYTPMSELSDGLP